MSKSSEVLRAVYNDKQVLGKVKKSVEEYAINIRSMEQLKKDSKDIEPHIKETYGITPTMFKKIVKASMVKNDNTEEVIDELELIQKIAKDD